jgi:hypothetical protein
VTREAAVRALLTHLTVNPAAASSHHPARFVHSGI